MSEQRQEPEADDAVSERAQKVQRWIGIVKAKEKKDNDWLETGRKIVRRYRAITDQAGSSPGTYNNNKYNIFWSNVQTMMPALYGRMPNPEVVRRYGDNDPVGNLAGLILERVLSFLMDDGDFDDAIRKAVKDRLLPGMGVVWERYVPTWGEEQSPKTYLQQAPLGLPAPMGEPPIGGVDADIGAIPDARSSPAGSPFEIGAMESGPQWLHPEGKPVDPKAIKNDEQGAYIEEGDPFREVLYEESVTEYVFWEDFTVSEGRSWRDIRRGGWVKRDWYLTKDEGLERFGEIFNSVPLDREPTGLDSHKPTNAAGDEVRKGHVWEIWDAGKRQAIWIAPAWPQNFLDVRDDPLKLEGFFPVAPPIMATTTSDRFHPVADYLEYRDQALTLDALTTRIDLILDAVKVAGVYDGSQKAELAQLFRPGAAENVLIPIEGYADLATKGGLKGIIEWIPLDVIVSTLNELFAAREKIKEDLYEITGMSDILRGQNDPDSTATAERIKGKYASLRLGDSQASVQRFIRDVIRIKAEIVCNMFAPETIIEMAGYDNADQATQGMVLQAIALLKAPSRRAFRIDIETDSTLAADEQEEQAQTVLLVSSITEFLAKAGPILKEAPELLPMMSELLQFSVRRFKAGRQLEEVISKGMQALQDKAAQAMQGGGQPDPETMKLQAQMQLEHAKAQAQVQAKQAELEVQKANDERDYAARQAELAQKAQTERELALIDQQTRIRTAEIDAAAKIEVARIGAKTDLGAAAYEMMSEAAGLDPEKAEAEEAAEGADMHGAPMMPIPTVAQPVPPGI